VNYKVIKQAHYFLLNVKCAQVIMQLSTFKLETLVDFKTYAQFFLAILSLESIIYCIMVSNLISAIVSNPHDCFWYTELYL